MSFRFVQLVPSPLDKWEPLRDTYITHSVLGSNLEAQLRLGNTRWVSLHSVLVISNACANAASLKIHVLTPSYGVLRSVNAKQVECYHEVRHEHQIFPSASIERLNPHNTCVRDVELLVVVRDIHIWWTQIRREAS
jgi:hypothetical protein